MRCNASASRNRSPNDTSRSNVTSRSISFSGRSSPRETLPKRYASTTPCARNVARDFAEMISGRMGMVADKAALGEPVALTLYALGCAAGRCGRTRTPQASNPIRTTCRPGQERDDQPRTAALALTKRFRNDTDELRALRPKPTAASHPALCRWRRERAPTTPPAPPSRFPRPPSCHGGTGIAAHRPQLRECPGTPLDTARPGHTPDAAAAGATVWYREWSSTLAHLRVPPTAVLILGAMVDSVSVV